MKPANRVSMFPAGTVLSANRTSASQQVYNAFVYAIQIVVTGTPTGTFKLQASNDAFESGIPGLPANWTDIANTSQAISAAGSVMWNIIDPGYNWVRVVYTDASGGLSTALITSSTCNLKGF